MEKTSLKRHQLLFISPQGKERIWREVRGAFSGEAGFLAEQTLLGNFDIPAIVRRGDKMARKIPVGFVPCGRIEGNRVRIAAAVYPEEIIKIQTPYETLTQNFACRSDCLRAIQSLKQLADGMNLQAGVFGSAALEIITGLPYTDKASDADLLIKPASYAALLDFKRRAEKAFPDIGMDFEVEFPNGYGVKLAEIFMDTRTVLGKSLDDVILLSKKDVLNF